MNRLTIDARRSDDGSLVQTWLIEDQGALLIHDESGAAALPLTARAIVATFARYAKPLAVALPDELSTVVPIGDRARLRAFRFRGWGDVEPSDYLVLEQDGREPVAAPANLVAAALRHLATAFAREG